MGEVVALESGRGLRAVQDAGAKFEAGGGKESFGLMDGAVPLTPALSRWEREKQFPVVGS